MKISKTFRLEQRVINELEELATEYNTTNTGIIEDLIQDAFIYHRIAKESNMNTLKGYGLTTTINDIKINICMNGKPKKTPKK